MVRRSLFSGRGVPGCLDPVAGGGAREKEDFCFPELQADFAGPQFPALSCQESQHGLREEAWRSGFFGKAEKF